MIVRKTRLRSVRPTPRRRSWACQHCRRKNDPADKRCAGCGIGRATKRTSLKARCDAMARELCRLLAGGRCARCGGAGSDWAHRFPRRHHSLRWSMENCDFLCRDCHQFFTDYPMSFMAWLQDCIGGPAILDLERRANELWDKDYLRVIVDLRAQLRKAKEKAA